MTTPTDLAAVRAAADTVLGRFGCNRADCRDCAKYVFATIPADATAPITAEWLREAWGFSGNDIVVGLWKESYWMDELADGWRLSLNDYRFTPRFTTRHQFTQLAACLGIQPQPPKAKE